MTHRRNLQSISVISFRISRDLSEYRRERNCPGLGIFRIPLKIDLCILCITSSPALFKRMILCSYFNTQTNNDALFIPFSKKDKCKTTTFIDVYK